MAAIDMAHLQLGFTEIRSPINGRTGSLLVNPGNLVKANDTAALVVVNEIRPIYVSFSVPEQHLAGIKARLAESELKVEAAAPETRLEPSFGVVSFLDNAVDTSTGTIQLKGTFANDDERLTPGQFVNVSLILETLENIATVPSQAIQNGPAGTFVFVVKPDKRVEVRPVTVALKTDETAAVKTGLRPGETVVTVGQLRLFDGKKVAVNKDAVNKDARGAKPGDGGKGKKKKKKDGERKKQKKSDKPAKTVDESPAKPVAGPAS
jgi:multidrug efflux system membrane fusion protein